MNELMNDFSDEFKINLQAIILPSKKNLKYCDME